MLEVDLKRVPGAELCCKVFMVNNKKWCYQLASVKQSALFCRNHYEHQVKTYGGDKCTLNSIQ